MYLNQTALVLATDEGHLFLYTLSTNSINGPIKLKGLATALKVFNDWIFIGVEVKGNFLPGPKSYDLQVIKTDSSQIITSSAHTGRITAIEYASIKGKSVFFTSALDGRVKAWELSADQLSLIFAGDMNLQSPPLSMQLSTPTLLLLGLENGSFAGWNLTTNTVEYLPAHSGEKSQVCSLSKLGNIIISGDRCGRVQLRGIENSYNLQFKEM